MGLNTFLGLLSFVFLVIGTQTVPIEAAPRISGGLKASPGQFPYQVSLRNNGHHGCGGTIISENYIVTAGHCLCAPDSKLLCRLRAPKELYSIRAGSISHSSGGKIVNISKLIIYPTYNASSGGVKDIALLKLSEPLTFNDYIKPIKLASKPVKRDDSITIAGWGCNSKYETLDTLQYNTNLTANPLSEKGILLVKHPKGFGACGGDSGGPAVHDNELVGVASFVTDKCGAAASDGYTMVFSYRDWLLENSDVKY